MAEIENFKIGDVVYDLHDPLAMREAPVDEKIYARQNGIWVEISKDTLNGILGYTPASEEDLNGKQDTLISGENIKTINGIDVLGEGDIEIKLEDETELPNINGYSSQADMAKVFNAMTSNPKGRFVLLMDGMRIKVMTLQTSVSAVFYTYAVFSNVYYMTLIKAGVDRYILQQEDNNSKFNQLLAGKQNIISDLATIRSGASKGASAVQPAELDTVRQTANEAKSIAVGKSKGYVFATKAEMDNWLDDASHRALLHQGDNLYILATDVPDYWWDGTQAQMLETQKVDLSDYLTSEQIDALYAKKVEMNKKVERVELEYHSGDNPYITYLGQSEHLAFEQIEALVMDETKFVTLLWEYSFFLLPQYYDGAAIVFTGMSVVGNEADAIRVAMSIDGDFHTYALGLVDNSRFNILAELVANKANQSSVDTLQVQVNRLFSDFAEYDKTDFPDVNFGTPTRAGAYIGANGQFVDATGYNVSNDIEVVRGNLYKLYVGNEATLPFGIAVFSKKNVVVTPSGEKVTYTPQFVSAGGATPKSGYLVFLATEDMTIVTSYPTSATKLEVVRYGVLASLCTQIDVLRKAVDLKSFADGYYAQMRVGLADNLTPRGEAVDAEFKERIAGGGMSITDGSSKYDEVRGNSLVWNQRAKSRLSNFERWSVVNYNDDGTMTIFSNTSSLTLFQGNAIVGHIYLFRVKGKSNGPAPAYLAFHQSSTTAFSSSMDYVTVIATARTAYGALFQFSGAGQDSSVTIDSNDLLLIDLTQMFGTGNEPATYEEFLRRKPEVADEYAYNEGEIVNNKVEGIKTTGVNLWDEQWELGTFNNVGEEVPNSRIIRTRNFVRIDSSKSCFAKAPYTLVLFYYDENKNFISTEERKNNTLNIPTNAHYLRFRIDSSYGTTYNNDICINVSNPAINGNYFPYEENTLDLSWIKDIKDENGVALFEDGMRSAGSAYDVVADKKAIKRIGVKVFDGTERWLYMPQGDSGSKFTPYFLCFPEGMKTNLAECIVLGYTFKNGPRIYLADGEKMSTHGNTTQAELAIRDDAYSSLDAWKQHLADLYAQGNPLVLYYELAEPIEINYDEKNMTIPVVAGGMEIAIAEIPSSPLKARIVYGMDAYQQIVANKNNVGTLASLATTDKSSLVAAINELAARIANLQNQ